MQRLRRIFAKVCIDFQAELIDMDGEGDHVHLLVEYPPKVAVSRLVNSLKGVSSRRLRSPAARYRKTLLERRPLVAFLLRLILRRSADLHHPPVHRTAADPSLNNPILRTAAPPALSFPGLKAQACRALGQPAFLTPWRGVRARARPGRSR